MRAKSNSPSPAQRQVQAGARKTKFLSVFDGPEWSYLVVEPAQERIYYRPGVKLKVKLLPDPPGSYYPYDPAQASERLKSKYGINQP